MELIHKQSDTCMNKVGNLNNELVSIEYWVLINVSMGVMGGYICRCVLYNYLVNYMTGDFLHFHYSFYHLVSDLILPLFSVYKATTSLQTVLTPRDRLFAMPLY